MATLIACADGDLTNAATWALVNATGTTFLNSQVSNTALTTSLVASSAFTPGAITIDAIAVKVASRASSPTGTMTVELATGGVQVPGTAVTINVSDLPLCTTTDITGGWQLFKFAAPVLLVAATAYTVRATTSSANQVNLYRDATAANWSRAIRTTTTQAPVAGDDMIICGEKTAAGAQTARTVTMNSVAATDYGSNVTGANGLISPAMAVGQGGTLTYGTAAATNYILRLSGNLIVYAGGTLNVGTVATPVPRGGTAWLEFDCAADGDFGLTVRNLGTYVHQGLSRTSGKDVWLCRLNTDEAIASTSLGVDTDTGWLDNDIIAVASTTQTRGQSEKGTLNGNAGASTLTVDGFAGAGGGLAFAHSGTAPIQAEIILLTRSTGVRGVTAGQCPFIVIRSTAVVDIDWAEFYYIGYTSSVPVIAIETTTGSCSVRYCSFHLCDGGSFTVASSSNNYEITDIAIFDCPNSSANYQGFQVEGGPDVLISNICALRSLAGFSTAIEITFFSGIAEDLIAVGSASAGISLSSDDSFIARRFTARAATPGISIGNGQYADCTLEDFTAIRNTGNGLSTSMYSGVIDTVFAQGNGSGTTSSVSWDYWLHILNFTSNKDAVGNTGYALGCTGGFCQIDGGAFGTTSTHSTGCISIGNAGTARLFLNNVDIADATIASNMSSWSMAARVSATRADLNDDINLTITHAGQVDYEASVFRTAAPSQRLTPSRTGVPLESGPVLVACDDGATKNISVWVRKTGAYAGSAPRLILKANAAMGVTADTVLDTLTVGADTWEELTGTTPTALMDGAFTFVVDCDGTAGSVYVDDWSQS